MAVGGSVLLSLHVLLSLSDILLCADSGGAEMALVGFQRVTGTVPMDGCTHG
jgi:hypothetical protein